MSTHMHVPLATCNQFLLIFLAWRNDHQLMKKTFFYFLFLCSYKYARAIKENRKIREA